MPSKSFTVPASELLSAENAGYNQALLICIQAKASANLDTTNMAHMRNILTEILKLSEEMK